VYREPFGRWRVLRLGVAEHYKETEKMQTENNMTLLAPPQVAPVMRETLATETENGTMGVNCSADPTSINNPYWVIADLFH